MHNHSGLGKMLHGRVRAAVVLAVLATSAGLVAVQPAAAVSTAGNGIYNVHIQDANSAELGRYTITTGSAHPIGAGRNVLFGGGTPSTSYNSVRSFSSGTDYVQGAGSSSSIGLGQYGSVTNLGTTGFRTTYVLPGPPATADSLTIVQDLRVNGTTFSNSSIEVTTTINNNDFTSVSVGVRYLWDVQIASDDGPTFQQIVLNGPIQFSEADYLTPNYQAFRIVDNDVNPTPPTFAVFGTVLGPPGILPSPTKPTRLTFASWSSSFGTAFDYTADPNQTVTVAGGVNDSAVLYYFGHNVLNALTVPGNGARTVSASIFATPTEFIIPVLTNNTQTCAVSVPPPQATHPGSITRNARYWFTHPYSDQTASTCATLLEMLARNGGGINLGFLCLPTTYRNADNELDAEDALIEALGFYYRSATKTGEPSGTQTDQARGSRLCNERKQLAIELIAATANLVLLGTDPANVTYSNGSTVTPFPSDLLDQATSAAAGDDPDLVHSYAALVRAFNNSGVTSNLPPGLTECSPIAKNTLRPISRDPTDRDSCPGANDTIGAATAIVRFPYKANLNLTDYNNDFIRGDCGAGGRDAFWKIAPPVAAPQRSFLVDTFGSNFDTVLTVWQVTSDSTLVQVTCNDDATIVNGNNPVGTIPQSQLSFTSDGVSTYYIVLEGTNDTYGNAKLKVTSY